jgi:hypothetical protein
MLALGTTGMENTWQKSAECKGGRAIQRKLMMRMRGNGGCRVDGRWPKSSRVAVENRRLRSATLLFRRNILRSAWHKS